MNLLFSVDYRTNWGEQLYITGNIPQLGEGDPAKAVRLELKGEQSWRLAITLPKGIKEFEYSYIVRHDNGSERHEWGKPHTFRAADGATEYRIEDHWKDQPLDKPFYSVVFSDCVCKRRNPSLPAVGGPGMLLLSVDAPMVGSDEVVAVTGSCDALGNWTKPVVMSDANYPTWTCAVPMAGMPQKVEYKFVILKTTTKEIVAWELCANRQLELSIGQAGECLMVNGLRIANPLPNWRGAGVAIPVFSLRSDEDFGVGEFYDLKKMVDWAALTGQNFIQVLPINDTTMTHTWTDSYPYNANSCFALHPMYLHLPDVGKLSDQARMEYYEEIRRDLNSLPEVDYERVNNTKNAYTRELFAEVHAGAVKSAEFKQFVKGNADWLMPYAAYCVLRDLYNTSDFSQWGEYATYDAGKIADFIKAHRRDIDYVCWLQMHLARQMKEVRQYAHAHGVTLKGDIPIGISRESADAWISPRLFNLDCQAGAPPDDFSVLGQNWGLPTYNWEEMNLDGFAWWKARFRKMAEYFDIYRIDHVLGFFRIWEIPVNQLHGLLGVFNPALPFTPDEMRENFDFWINPELHARPYIMEWFLHDFFGEYTDEARRLYLRAVGDGRYELLPEFDDQVKIARHFGNLPDDEKNTRLCNALQGLVDQVLFIEDPKEKGKFHPRISAQYTYTYRALNDYERWCFDRLYNDFFYHRHNDFWYGKAMWKLPPIIDATSMLTCAEDLGMIPSCVPAVMRALEILTLDIQRMPKDPSHEFGNPAGYPYYSVCTTSTHDMGGIRQWWEENPEKTQRFYNNMMHEHGEAPAFAEPWVCEKILDMNLRAPSMLCILPLQDWLSIDGKLRRCNPYQEQINVPAESRHYWRYRMHLTLEELLAENVYANHVRSLIMESGR